MDTDLRQIASHLGGQREAFEELCCQLAVRTLRADARFVRLRGAGGDGGIECFADLPRNRRRGWQAKYVFDIEALLTQTNESLTTALAIHPTLTEYVVCFPFDVTGPTKRKGKSAFEKFEIWKAVREQRARRSGRKLKIEAWPASKLRELLIEHDKSGGIRAFFFNQMILTSQWFTEHIALATRTAGPRYTPKLNIETDLWKWVAALGRTRDWVLDFETKLHGCRKAHKEFAISVRTRSGDTAVPEWHSDLKNEALAMANATGKALDDLAQTIETADRSSSQEFIARLDSLLGRLRQLESKVLDGLERKHGKGRPDSPGFRQFMAEYMVSFPTANLDRVRELIVPLGELRAWLASPAGALASERAFVLAGAAGSGKTHGLCDSAERRLRDGLLTCVVFGHQFQGTPDPWTRLLESLSLPGALGMDGLLDALNAAGAASGSPLLLCIDALNETRPLPYWRERIAAIVEAVGRWPHIRLCFSCRSSFLPLCLPDDHGLVVAEHAGFEGVEREACRAFFQYYDLVPPIAPILAPELSNPLYLKLVCQTLRAHGLKQLPTGWHGLAPTIKAFLEAKEQQFAVEHSTSPGARIVSGSLMMIVRTMAELGSATLPWSQAQAAILKAKPGTNASEVLSWLIRADLLIDDAPPMSRRLDAENEIRPAFERLGDFLVAGELLERSAAGGLEMAARPEGVLHGLVQDDESAARNVGVLTALAVLVPEGSAGIELPDLFDRQPVHAVLLRIAVRAFHFRDPATFTDATRNIVRQLLRLGDFSAETFDALIAITWQPSAIDATWLDVVLRCSAMAKRDAFWCAYLHDRFESRGAVQHLIDAAFELPLDQLDESVADRWSTALCWFTAAADRRVKDRSTRALTKVLSSRPAVIPAVLSRMIDCDDDEVRERVLLVSYGALLLSRDVEALRNVLKIVRAAIQREPSAFDNALTRDDVRCIAELSVAIGVSRHEDLEWATKRIGGPWPLELPSADDLERWGELLFEPDEFSSDFYKYSMNCLEPWTHEVSKEQLAEWILQRVARDFGYEGSGAEEYDRFMLGRHGGGRGKQAWAERIGKKYQWLAMYQVASRLNDHVERKRDRWNPAPLRTPLVLLEERKIDPTMWRRSEDADESNAWWITARADLDLGDRLNDCAWVARDQDVPSLSEMLGLVEHNARKWRLLLAYPSWSRRDKEGGFDQRYRRAWIHLESYLVARKDIEIAYACLHGRNFFGQWMPQGANWLYGFAGEYPWATAFNTDPDHWHRHGGRGTELPVSFSPATNSLTVEFEYDATKAPNYSLCLPGRDFFAPGDLWWNGTDGFLRRDGITVFRDPSIVDSGPGALLVDADDLQARLKTTGKCLIWTMLGEKQVIGGVNDDRTPSRTFSQIASLDAKGVLRIGERRFFARHDEDASPGAVPSRPLRKRSQIAKGRAGRKSRRRL